MGFFAVIFSLIIVIIQTTSILMGRGAHEWTLPLLQVKPNTTYISELNWMFENYDNKTLPFMSLVPPAYDANNSMLWLQSMVQNAANSMMYNFTQENCVQRALLSQQASTRRFPVQCLVNMHQRQEIKRLVSEEFNPHLILLTLCVTHAIFCVSKLKKTIWSTTLTPFGGAAKVGIQHPHSISLPLTAIIMYILLAVVFIIEGTRNNKGTELVQYPTILFAVAEAIGTVWFIYFFMKSQSKNASQDEQQAAAEATSESSHWFNANHLQFVGIPTALLTLVIIGIRFWNDALTHLVFLSVACNAVYLDLKIQDLYITKKVLQLLYVGLPIYCIYTAHIQWGDSDNWRYVVGLMGCAAITPFWIHPWINTSSGGEGSYVLLPKHLSKYSMFAASASLLSLVINLAMFLD